MKKVFFSFLMIMALAACEKSEQPLKCGDYEISKKLQGESLSIVINGDPVILSQAVSASGVRYVGVLNDTNVVMWNKGSHWTLFLNEDPGIECE